MPVTLTWFFQKSALQQQLRALTEQSSKQEALQSKRLTDVEREKRELEEDLEGFREFNAKLQNALRESSLRYAAALKTKIKVRVSASFTKITAGVVGL